MRAESVAPRLVTPASVGVLVIAGLGLLGYLPGWGLFGSLGADYIPMAPSTATAFIALAGLLIAQSHRLPRGRTALAFAVAASALVAIFGFLEVGQYFTGVDLNFEDTLIPDRGRLGAIPVARMSPATGAVFFFAGASVLLLLLRSESGDYRQRAAQAAALLAAAVEFVATVFLLGYGYGAPLLYGAGSTIPMAATTATAFALLGVGCLAEAGESCYPLSAFAGESTRARLMRAFVPLTAAAVLLNGVLSRLVHNLSWVNEAVISGLLAVAVAFAAAAMISKTAKTVAASLDRAQAERRRAEERIALLNRDLERRVRIRTRELEKAVGEMEAFSSAVSHDLRQPLHSVGGFVGLLEQDLGAKLDSQSLFYLSRARAGLKAMGKMIDDLLQLSRVRKMRARFEEVDLSSVAEQVVEDLRASDLQREAEVVVQSGVRVYGDEGLLILLLQNLIGNAWKFSGKRAGARIEFGSVTTEEGGEAYFVRDNGAGFDVNEAGGLFLPFHRLHSQEDFPGTGVGLATVSRIVDRHGGRIWYEAAVEEGATFYFTLCAAEEEGFAAVEALD